VSHKPFFEILAISMCGSTDIFMWLFQLEIILISRGPPMLSERPSLSSVDHIARVVSRRKITQRTNQAVQTSGEVLILGIRLLLKQILAALELRPSPSALGVEADR
jgi:hypothetical protein